MRIFAFISVLVGHKIYDKLEFASQNQSLHITIRYLAEALLPLCLGGAAGVIVFFLTSGYIITHVLQKEETAEFIVKRIFRIYPLYIFAVITEALLARIIDGVELPAELRSGKFGVPEDQRLAPDNAVAAGGSGTGPVHRRQRID